MRSLPAAAVPVGAVVRLYPGSPSEPRDVEVVRVHNAEPEAGVIRWETTGSDVSRLPASALIEIVSLP